MPDPRYHSSWLRQTTVVLTARFADTATVVAMPPSC